MSSAWWVFLISVLQRKSYGLLHPEPSLETFIQLSSCDAGEDSSESLRLQGDPTIPFWRRSALRFFGRNDGKAETPVLWPPHAESWLIGKDSDAERDWGQEEKGTTEDEMARWHHWLDGRESEWTPGVGDGQGGLACCDSWGRKGLSRLSDWIELNWIEILSGGMHSNVWKNIPRFDVTVFLCRFVVSIKIFGIVK